MILMMVIPAMNMIIIVIILIFRFTATSKAKMFSSTPWVTAFLLIWVLPLFALQKVIKPRP